LTLTQQARIGTFWTGLSSLVGLIVHFGQLIVLARLLSPVDFGLAAMVMVVIGLAQVYADAGVGNAIIHRQDNTVQALASLYWLNIGIGIALFLVIVLATPAIIDFFGEPRLETILPLAGLSVLVIPFGQQFQALMQKNLQFRLLAVIEISASLIGAAVAIALASKGFGVHALIYGFLANAFVRTVCLVVAGIRQWRPAFRFKFSDVRGYFSFGLYQMGERTINFLSQRVDQLIIGTAIGALSLGYYNLAFSLAIFPVSRINPVLTRVAFPVFAKVQDDNAKLLKGYMLLQRIVALINFPILVGMAVTAPVFVPIILGPQWEPSIPLIQILAFVGLLRATGNPVGALLLAKGRANVAFFWNLGVVAVLIPVVLLGAKLHGAVGVAIAVLATQIVLFWANYYVNIRSTIGPCLLAHLSSFTPAAASAGLMGGVVMAFSWTLGDASIVSLAYLVGVGVVAYGLLNVLLFRRSSLEALGYARGDSR
jgi:O-antigen/teichoic acid export membrane protein